MVIYDLACDGGHRFEGWFQDLDACEAQAATGQLSCPICGSSDVKKQVTASAIKRSTEGTPPAAMVKTGVDQVQSGGGQPHSKSADGDVASPPARPTPAMVREAVGVLSAFVRANTEDVGPRFADEARKIHHGDAPERMIRGQATEEEEEALTDEGVPFVKLPVVEADD